MQIRHISLTVAVLALVATACATTTEPPASSTSSTVTPPGPVTTLSHVDPEPPADEPSAGWTIAFEAGTPWGPDGHGEGGYWESRLLAGEGQLLVTAMGEGEDSNVIDLYSSRDGIGWEQLNPVFGTYGIEYFDLALAGPDGFILGGFTFDEDSAVSWMMESTDGAVWEDVDTTNGLGAVAASFFQAAPDAGIYGTITSMVRYGDTYIAGGNFEDAATVWVSSDGTDWEQHIVAEGFGSFLNGLTVVDDRVYAVGNAPDMTVWESADGATWTAIAGADAFGIEPAAAGGSGDEFFEDGFHSGRFLGLAAHGEGLAALITVQRRPGEIWCFVDAQQCNRESVELVSSTDGVTWQTLPLPDDETLLWDGSLAAVDDTLILAEANDGRLQVWTAGNLGSGSPIEVPVLPNLGFDIVTWDSAIEEGVTYGYPFWTHCGIDRLGEFNGQVWTLIEDTSSHLSHESSNDQSEMLYGTIELVASDRIEYTLSDVVIATYAPAESPDEMLCA